MVFQVGRALKELGVQMIPAYSPQARGRPERSFSTWQGRLSQELRLHGVLTSEAANVFLATEYVAEFNRKFTLPAPQLGSAFLRCPRRNMELIFSQQFERTVDRDNTVGFHNLVVQIDPAEWRGIMAGCNVINCAPFVREFLASRFGRGPVKLSQLCASDVVRFVQRVARRLHLKRAKLLTAALRTFLHYLRYRGAILHDRAGAVSSPTGTALLCCRCAFDCSTAQRKTQRRQLNRLRNRLTHSGTARSATVLCTSSNGSPPPKSCFALHLNLTGAQHEAFSKSAAFARASARIRIPCLICPEMLAQLPLQLPILASLRSPAVLSNPQTRRPYLSSHLRGTSGPDQTYSKCIAFHGGGFLQVAVSEAPR